MPPWFTYELPLAVVQERYGFHLFRFKELAEPVMFEPYEGSRATMPADDVR